MKVNTRFAVNSANNVMTPKAEVNRCGGYVRGNSGTITVSIFKSIMKWEHNGWDIS